MKNAVTKNKMKNLFLAAFFILPFLSQATVWRVNGNPGIDADFTTLIDAVDAASNGDTIYLEPLQEGQSYEGLILTKPLTIIGTGINISSNDSTQYSENETRITRIWFDPGSEGSRFQGIVFTSTYPNIEIPGLPGENDIDAGQSQIVINACCITIDGCKADIQTSGINMTYRANDCLIENCITTQIRFSNTSSSDEAYVNIGLSGTVVRNSKFTALGKLFGGGFNGTVQSLFVDHCIIDWNSCSSNVQTKNTFFSNNIFVSGTGCTPCVDGSCTYLNNLSVSTIIPSGSGNITGIPLAGIFDPAFSSHPELQYQLAPGSPAIGASTTGGDMGMFGGEQPYQLSGMPSIPSIFELNVNPVGTTATQSLNVNLKAKSHE